MMVTGNMRVLKKLDGGMDTNGQAWGHYAAIANEEKVSEEERTSDFYILKTFGSLTEYIDRNLNMPRRVQVSGKLVMERYVKDVITKREVEIDGTTYEIDFTTQVETQRATIYAHFCEFLDKKRDKSEQSGEEKIVVVKK